MRPKKFAAWLIAAALLAAAALAFHFGVWLPGGVSLPTGVGLRGPLEVTFPAGLAENTPPDSLQLSPPTPGRWEVQGTTARFWPQGQFTPGATLTLTLPAGLRLQDGRRLLGMATLSTQVRQPQVAYLGQVSTGAEIWLGNADGSGSVQLTHTEGQVQEFSPAPDGSQLVFAAANSQGGADLYLIQRDGSGQRLLLGCGPVRCRQPAWKPDGRELIYARAASGNAPQLHSLDLTGHDTDTGYRGQAPSWSPDGETLVYDDPNQGVYQVVRPGSDWAWSLPSTEGGSLAWSADGSALVFLGQPGPGSTPYTAVYRAELSTRQVQPLFTARVLKNEYGLPLPSPAAAEWLVAWRPAGTYVTRQLAILSDQGDMLQAVTDEVLFSHGGYSWSPDGSSVLYQRLQLGSSQNHPEVLVWRRSDGRLVRLAQDAALPLWVP